MKILTVSDVERPALLKPDMIQRLGPVDLVLSCGDLPPEYLSQLRHGYNAPLYYVCGNHDIRYSYKPPAGCCNAHARVVRAGSLRILGLEGSHWYNGGPFQYTEADMRRVIRRLWFKLRWPKRVDIVMTHAPPRHVKDGEDMCHRGFESFVTLIHRYRPAYFIHGHIHQSFTVPQQRITPVNHTQVVNTYGYYLFEIEDHPPV